MLSLIRYEVWRDGKDEVADEGEGGGIFTIWARSVAHTLLEEGLITIEKDGRLLVLRPVPGTILDRNAFPQPPEDVGKSGWGPG